MTLLHPAKPAPLRTLRRAALYAALATTSLAAQAHHVWLEPTPDGTALVFGERADNLREASPGLLDKFSRPRALVQSSNGQLREATAGRGSRALTLPAAAAGESILFEEAGYPMFERKEGDKVVQRTAWVPAARWVNGSASPAARLTLDLVPGTAAGEFVVSYQGKPLPKAKVEIISPSGWARSAQADDTGKLVVRLPWRGLYALEVKHEDKAGLVRDGVKADRALYVTTLTVLQDQGLASPPLPDVQGPSAAP